MAEKFYCDRLPIGSVKRLPDGRLRVDGAIGRSGIQLYPQRDGTMLRVWRPKAEVFKPESMATFELVPLTDNHPPIAIDSTNAVQYGRGTTGERVTQDGDFLRTTIVINDEHTIAKAINGKRELSNGYFAETVFDSGIVPAGERDAGKPYDAYQRNIRGNHVAIVDKGRAGPEARLLFDAAVSYFESDTEAFSMDQLVEALAKLKAAETEIANLKEQTKTLQMQCDSANAAAVKAKQDLDAANKLRMDSEGSFDQRVKDRANLIGDAGIVLRDKDGKALDVSSLPDREIRVAVVHKVDGLDYKADSYSDDYVRAAYDGAVMRAKRGANSLAAVVVQSGISRDSVSNEDAEAKATREMNKRRNEAVNAKEGK